MAAPAQFIYTYESKQQADRPANNATYITASTRDDPNFKWQNSGQKTSRGATIWVRATKRRITPEYKAFLAAEKARRAAELDVISGLIGQISMAAPGSNNINNNRGNYGRSLITGLTKNQRKQAAAQAAKLKAEINALNAMMAGIGMEGGKKRRHTRRKAHTKRRHTHRK
jgi:hypothetical protein